MIDMKVLNDWENGDLEPDELALHLQKWLIDGSLERLHNSWARYFAYGLLRCGIITHPDPAYDPDKMPRDIIKPPPENIYIH